MGDVREMAEMADCFGWGRPIQADAFDVVRDLQPLLDADAVFQRDDYPEPFLEPFRHDQRLYGLPYKVTLRVLLYNEQIFAQAGLQPPQAQWTLEDFTQAAYQLTTKHNDQYGFAVMRSMQDDVLFFLEQSDATLRHDNEGVPRVEFTHQQAIQAIHLYVDLLRNTSPHQRFGGYTTDDQEEVVGMSTILNGQVGMWFNFGSAASRFFNTSGVPTRMAPLPWGQQGVSRHDVELTGLYIAARSQAPEACWTWLKYLSDEPRGYHGAFPTSISVADSDEFAEQTSPDSAAIHQAYRNTLTHTQTASANPLFWHSDVDYFWLYRAIDRAIQGHDLETELALAQTLTNNHIACVASGGQPRTCALQVDGTYEGRLRDDP